MSDQIPTSHDRPPSPPLGPLVLWLNVHCRSWNGGTLTAANRPGGGLEVGVLLPGNVLDH